MTRARRTALRIVETARRILDGESIGPAVNCHICGKGLGAPPSIERGIGSECWQHVLQAVEVRKTPEALERYGRVKYGPDPTRDYASDFEMQARANPGHWPNITNPEGIS